MTAVDLRWHRRRLPLARPFKIATGTVTEVEVIVTALSDGEFTGLGEAAPSERVTGETLDSVEHFLQWARTELRDAKARDWQRVLDDLHENICGNSAARAAVDLALHDLVGQREDKPVYALYDLPPGRLETSMTVSADAPGVMADEARTYVGRGFHHLKLKVGDPKADPERVEAVRKAAPSAVLRADANTVWTYADAERVLPRLAAAGVRLVEQPFPAGAWDEMARISRESPVPIYADETVMDVHDVERLKRVGFEGGVNLKLAKTGGIRPAVAAARAARDAGYPVQFGCMVETGIGITAATHLLALADWADLDGNLLLARDPFNGVRPREGWVEPPRGAGLGLPAP